MIGIKATRRKAGKEEAEKPFWISFSDLMTALMVLFLVAMAVALIAVSKGLVDIDNATKDAISRKKSIDLCLVEFKATEGEAPFEGIVVNGNSIDFGTLVKFGNNSHAFESSVHERFIRSYVPRVLQLAASKECSKWLKRVVVEGFASRTGDYLYNLNLSYLRSQRVLCALLNTQADDALTPLERSQVQNLFLVGGSSFNTAASTDESKSRRVELKLEFRDLGSDKEKAPDIPLDPGLKCPNDLR
jgi:hypothetical protein